MGNLNFLIFELNESLAIRYVYTAFPEPYTYGLHAYYVTVREVYFEVYTVAEVPVLLLLPLLSAWASRSSGRGGGK